MLPRLRIDGERESHFFARKIFEFTKWRLIESYAIFVAIRLKLVNKFSSRSIVDKDSAVDISLTSHGDRLKKCYLSIESIGRGIARARCVTLWVDSENFFSNPPSEIKRLERRGLRLCFSANYGPHTKYFPQIIAGKNDVPLVTADDDIIYPRDWLSVLEASYSTNKDFVHCYRAHRIKFESTKLASYAQWRPCQSTDPSYWNFATGVSGVLYPPGFLTAAKDYGTKFLEICPKQDDVWLHIIAIRNGFKIRQVAKNSVHFPLIPGSQREGLVQENLLNGRNDEQIRASYSDSDLSGLISRQS